MVNLITKYKKIVNEYLRGKTPIELADEYETTFPVILNDEGPTAQPKPDLSEQEWNARLSKTREDMIQHYVEMFGLNNENDKIPNNWSIDLKRIAKGGFNTVFKTNLKDPNNGFIVLRASNSKLNTKQEREFRIKENQFTQLVDSYFPGEATEYTYYANINSVAENGNGWAFEFKEGFDMDLWKYLGLKITNDQKIFAVNAAFDAMQKLLDVGLYCFDVKPENFLVKIGKRPVNYIGNVNDNSVFVRVTDLGADFCTREKPPGQPQSTFEDGTISFDNTYSKENFATITKIQMLLMCTGQGRKQRMPIGLLRNIAIQQGMCNKNTASKFIKVMLKLITRVKQDKNRNKKTNWIEVYNTFRHYMIDKKHFTKTSTASKFKKVCPKYKNPVDEDEDEDEYEDEDEDEYEDEKRSPPKRKKKKKPRSPKRKKCNPRLKRKNQICNTKTGRWNNKKKKTRSPKKKKKKARSPKRKKCNPRLKRKNQVCNTKTGRWNKKKKTRSPKKKKKARSPKRKKCNPKLKRRGMKCNSKTGRWNKK